jgi:flagellar motor switch protein FliN/FliY
VTAATTVSKEQSLVALRGIWAESILRVVSQVAGFSVNVEPEIDSAASAAADDQTEAWALFTTSKALHGEMALLATEAGAVQLGQLLLSEPPDPAKPFEPGQSDAYEELLRQIAGQVATGLKSAAGGEVEIKLSSTTAPAWKAGSRTSIRISGEKLTPIRVVLLVSTELAESFPAPLEQAAPASGAREKAEGVLQSSAAANGNLALLLDVTLDATICFGQREMLLREILDLHPGAAVVLDRHVEEPVELLVGGRMVARGEVVIVDGNYGLRITEIVSPQQRVASLMDDHGRR